MTQTKKVKIQVENNISPNINECYIKEADSDFDIIHKIRNQIHAQTLASLKPDKNSLSYLVYTDNTKKLHEKLMSSVANIDERDCNGGSCSWTPLYWSVKLKRYECAKILLQNGANINIVINDLGECCGTSLDLAILRNDTIMEALLREHAIRDDVNLGQSFKAIRTKLRGKAPAFNFRYYSKKTQENIL